tara:strand:+ start:129 stop:347 length:219 start_codon:yes stop_codon:yes gene_type:complete
MPKIFKKNKLALIIANIVVISIWIPLISFIVELLIYDDAPFYIFKLGDLIIFIPPIWITYYLWIVKQGLNKK